jgi:hypothetical protein
VTAAARLRSNVAEAVAALAERFGDQLSTGQAIRAQHGATEGLNDPLPPDAVLFARSTEDVAAAVRLCAEHRFPVIAFGAGSSLEGQLSAVEGGLAISLAALDQVLEVNAADLDCRVQAGRDPRGARTRRCGRKGCSSRSIPAPTPPSAAWPRRGERHQRRALRHHARGGAGG